VGAAVEVTVRLNAVADNLAPAMLAGGGKGMDGALEAVEGTRACPGHTYLESLVVLISADLALGHDYHPFPASIPPTLSCTS
jgi:hypothetical protein